MPTTWIESKPSLGVIQRGHQPPHPVQAEPHPEQLQRQQVALGLRPVISLTRRRPPPARAARPPTAPARRSAARACRARPGPPAAAPWRRSPGWRACRSARVELGVDARRSGRSSLAIAASRSSPAPPRISTTPPGIGTAATGVCARVGRVAVERQPRQPREVLGGLLVPGRRQPRGSTAPALTSAPVAPASQRLDRGDRALDRGLGARRRHPPWLGAAQRGHDPLRPAAPPIRGSATRSPRSRTG